MMKKNIAIIIVIISVIISSACSAQVKNSNVSNQDTTVTGIIPTPNVKDYTPNKELISNDVTIETNQHNVYKGVIGDQEIMLDIYRKKNNSKCFGVYKLLRPNH
jgi:ABC-type phosphate/phosphonate transport system substrate-binding protein